MPYDAAKFVRPSTTQSQVAGATPPSFEPTSHESALMATPAKRKRAAADVNGGTSSSPSRITSHVLPHTRHITAIDPLVTSADGLCSGRAASVLKRRRAR